MKNQSQTHFQYLIVPHHLLMLPPISVDAGGESNACNGIDYGIGSPLLSTMQERNSLT